MSFIKETLSDFEIKRILETANNDIDLIREKYQIMDGQNINNIVGFLLTAIKRDFRPPQKKVKQNRFVNYEQRTDWDFEALEKINQKWLRQEASTIIQLDKILENIDIISQQNEIKAKIDYESLLLSFPYAKEKIEKIIKILAVLLLDDTYTFLMYEGKIFSKTKATEIMKNLDYNNMTDRLINHFDESVHDMFMKLSNYQ